MVADVSDMVQKLRRGKVIRCVECGKGNYVTKPGYTEKSHSFWCEKCGHLLHVDPINSFVE